MATATRRRRRRPVKARQRYEVPAAVAQPHPGGEAPKVSAAWLSDGRLVAALFVLLSLSLGSWMAFTIPPLQVPDEWAHLVRVDDTAELRWKADMNDPSIGAIGPLTEIFRAPIEKKLPGQQAIAFQCRSNPACNQRLDPESTSSVDAPTATIYSFVPYMAASVPWIIGRAVRAPVMETFYAARIANLLTFTALTALAILLMPVFRLMLTTVALLPMTLQQAASVSADSLTLGLSFFFIGVCVRFIATDEQISNRAWLLTTLVALVLTLCKFNVFLLLLTVAIPRERFGGNARKIVSIAVLVSVSALAAVAWQVSNQENASVFRGTRDASNIPMQENIVFLRDQPWQVPVMLLRDWERSIVEMTPYAIAGLGHFSVPAPPWLTPAALVTLLALSLFPDGRVRLRVSQRMIFVSIFVASALSLGALMFVFETPAPYLELARQGSGRIHGIQGRYYLPVLPVLLAGFAIGTGIRARWWRLAAPALAVVVVIAGNTAMFASVRATYDAYQPLGYLAGPQDGKLLRATGPGADGRVFIVARGTRHWVQDREWLERYGFRLEETTDIPEAEMAQIPEGDSVSIAGARRGDALELPWETAAARYEGKVLRCRNGANAIYLVDGGRLRHIQRLEWLRKRNIADEDIVVISETELQNLHPGEPVP